MSRKTGLHHLDSAFRPRRRRSSTARCTSRCTCRSPTATATRASWPRCSRARAQGYAYGRQGNPTTAALEAKVNRDGRRRRAPSASPPAWPRSARSCSRCCATAITSSSSAFLFGNTNSLFDTLAAHGSRRHASSMRPTSTNVEAAITPATRLVFVETIANPRTQVADLARIGELCARARHPLRRRQHDDLAVAVPAEDRRRGLVVNALTKYIGGHGNALGGSVTDTGLFDWTRYPNISDNYKGPKPRAVGHHADPQEGPARLGRHAGRRAGAPHRRRRGDAGAAHGAAVRECAGARASFSRRSPRCAPSTIPGSPRIRSTRWRASCSAVTARCCRSSSTPALDCFDFLNRLRVVVLSSNLGDNRTLAIPVAHTIF